MSKLEELKKKPIQQIWRDHLLTLSLFITNNDFQTGDLYICIQLTIIIVISQLKNMNRHFNRNIENYFKPLTIEMLTETIKKFCNEDWINEFENRYLKFDKIEKASR